MKDLFDRINAKQDEMTVDLTSASSILLLLFLTLKLGAPLSFVS